MAQGTLTSDAWQECEALRHDLSGARCDFTCAADSLKLAMNPTERAKNFIRERPLATVLTTLAVGAIAVRLLPALLWRSKGGLLKRFAGELIKGAAGMALPLITSRLSTGLKARQAAPNTMVFTGRETILP